MSTDSLPEEHSSWPGWADSLRRYGLDELAAWLLEAAGPLTVIGAQLLHAGGLFLQPALSRSQCNSLASLLEDGDEAQAFVRFLRQGGVS